MKRQKERCAKPDNFKRQKSHIDDKLPASGNDASATDDKQLGHANLEAERGTTLEENQQAASSEVLYLRRSEHDINGSRTGIVAAAKKSCCVTSSTNKPNTKGRKGKSRPGFGFTKGTKQYRTIVNKTDSFKCENDSDNTDRNIKKECNKKTNVKKEKTENRNLSLATCIGENGAELYFSTRSKKAVYNDMSATNDLEMDVIITSRVQEKTLEHAPEQAPHDYVDKSPKKLPTKTTTLFLCMPIGTKIPDEETKILIPHPKADSPEGDDFGAILSTYTDVKKHKVKYYRHFLVGMITGPAKEMKIMEDDELVLVNDIFVPDFSHVAVLNFFNHVQVDGKTRFSLVVRRVVKGGWQWIETSATLAPATSPDKGPIVKRADNTRLEPTAGKYEANISRHLYKVPGTQKYLEITDRNVRIDIFKDGAADSDKIILKHCMFWPSDHPGHIDFAASLCDSSMTSYIGMDKAKSRIVLKKEPEWFKLILEGSKVRFQLNDQYLGYDRAKGEVKARKDDCVFEELPASTLQEQELKSFPDSQATPSVGLDYVDVGKLTTVPAASPLQEMEVESPNRTAENSNGDEEHMESSKPNNRDTLLYDRDDSDDLQSSYNSNKSTITNSSGYGSLSQSLPNEIEYDDPGMSCLDYQGDSMTNNQPKTPITPLINMSLFEKPHAGRK